MSAKSEDGPCVRVVRRSYMHVCTVYDHTFRMHHECGRRASSRVTAPDALDGRDPACSFPQDKGHPLPTLADDLVKWILTNQVV